MEITYEIINCTETCKFYIYKNVYIRGELKSAYLIFESQDANECQKILKTLRESK